MLVSLYRTYEIFFSRVGDGRVTSWALMGGPGPLLTLLGLYWLLVRWILPTLMVRRAPLRLTALLTVYNSAQVGACSWIVYQMVLSFRRNNMSVIGCDPVDYSDRPSAVQLAELCWWYLIVKLVDLVETIFFVLRKKCSQVSNLHLYHHISTPLFTWISVKFAAGGASSVYMVTNSGVHVFMYLYYLLTGLGLTRPLAPWKRYLTLLQMVQFCLVIVHAMQTLQADCHFHKLLPAMFIPNVGVVFYMFSEFYSRSYASKTPAVSAAGGRAAGISLRR